MKINGVIIDGPNEELLVLPHRGQNIPITARAVMNFDEFNATCPPPKPPVKLTRDKGRVDDVDDPGYKEAIELWEEKRSAWIVLESLKPTEIEWSKVDLDKPSTWKHWQQDFQDAGLSTTEVQRIMRLVMEVNCLDESKLEWAREVFLNGQQNQAENSTSQSSEPATSKSGQPVCDSE